MLIFLQDANAGIKEESDSFLTKSLSKNVIFDCVRRKDKWTWEEDAIILSE